MKTTTQEPPMSMQSLLALEVRRWLKWFIRDDRTRIQVREVLDAVKHCRTERVLPNRGSWTEDQKYIFGVILKYLHKSKEYKEGRDA